MSKVVHNPPYPKIAFKQLPDFKVVSDSDVNRRTWLRFRQLLYRLLAPHTIPTHDGKGVDAGKFDLSDLLKTSRMNGSQIDM